MNNTEEFLYHGSKMGGLKTLFAKEAGHGGKMVYAVKTPLFAAIFINRPGGSLVQAWGRDETTGVPYLVELKENIIDINYKNQKGSIYEISPKDFHHVDDMWSEELGHEGDVSVIHEIVISDVGQYLLDEAEKGNIKIVSYKDRFAHPAGSQELLLETAVLLVKKYGDRIMGDIKKYQPDILIEVEKRIKRSS